MTRSKYIQRFWLVASLLAAGWAFMVSDEKRFSVLEGIADKVLNAIPVERWLAS